MFWLRCIQRDSLAVYLLKKQQVNRLDLTQYLSHGTRKDEDSPMDGSSDNEPEEEQSSNSSKSPLQLYTVNLNEQAADGRTDPLIGREKKWSVRLKFSAVVVKQSTLGGRSGCG